jgi:hypothetical protein
MTYPLQYDELSVALGYALLGAAGAPAGKAAPAASKWGREGGREGGWVVGRARGLICSMTNDDDADSDARMGMNPVVQAGVTALT